MYKFDYVEKITENIDRMIASQGDGIMKLAAMVADCVAERHIIHVFGTGHSHMIGLEMFSRAGGLPNVNAMLDPDSLMSFGSERSGAVERLEGLADIVYDQYKIEKGDLMIVISNSGRNAMPIEMAMRSKKEGIYTVAITNLDQSKLMKSRHSSGRKLYEEADLVLNTCGPEGDASVAVGGVAVGPASTVLGSVLVNTVVSEAIKILEARGGELPVLTSQNVDTEGNHDYTNSIKNRIKFR